MFRAIISPGTCWADWNYLKKINIVASSWLFILLLIIKFVTATDWSLVWRKWIKSTSPKCASFRSISVTIAIKLTTFQVVSLRLTFCDHHFLNISKVSFAYYMHNPFFLIRFISVIVFILITVQRAATQSSLFIILQVHSTCLVCQLHPSSGVHKTITTPSGTGHVVLCSYLPPTWPS